VNQLLGLRRRCRVELVSFVHAGYGFRHLSPPPLRVFRTRSTSMVALESKKSQPAGVTTGLPVIREELEGTESKNFFRYANF
jgi:hypothetical protein